jgi:transposase-like protein
MGRHGYPPEFRRNVLDLIEAGRKVAEVARDLVIGEQSIYTWRRQDRIDGGLEPGLTSGEKAELAAAKSRIAELEAELAATLALAAAIGADDSSRLAHRPDHRCSSGFPAAPMVPAGSTPS